LGAAFPTCWIRTWSNLLNEQDDRDCQLAVREVKRMDEVLKELELQKSPSFD